MEASNLEDKTFSFSNNFSKFLESNGFAEEKSRFDEAIESLSNLDQTLVFLGDTSAGKTTIVNKIISYDPESKSFNKNGILPANKDENTFFIWIVKASQNNEFIIRFRGEEFRSTKLLEAKKKIKEIDEEQKKMLSEKKDSEDFPIGEVTVFIPQMIPKLTIIDFPGVSSDIFWNNFQKKLKNIWVCYIFVKSLDEPQIKNQYVLKNLKNLMMQQNRRDKNIRESLEEMKNNNRYFYIFFTKKDKVMEITAETLHDLQDEEYEESQLHSENLERAMDKIDKNIEAIESLSEDKGIIINGIYLFNCIKIEEDQRILQRFVNSYFDFQEMNKCMINVNLVNLAQDLLNNIAKKQTEKKLKEDKSSKIIEESYEKFLKEIEKDISTFMDNVSSYKAFKENERNLFGITKNIIKKANKKVENKKTWKKNDFIKIILEEAKVELMNRINSRANEKTNEIIKKYLKDLIQEFGVKNLRAILNLKNSENFLLDSDQIAHDTITLIFGLGALSAGCAWGTVGFLAARLGTIAIEAAVPGLGWLTAGLTIGASLFGFKNYIGLYDSSDCCNSTFETFCAIIKENKSKIAKEIIESQKIHLSTIHNNWKEHYSRFLLDDGKLKEQLSVFNKNIVDIKNSINEKLPKEKNISDPRKLINFDDFGFNDQKKGMLEDLKGKFNDFF